MYNDIGKKLKIVATIFFYLTLIACVFWSTVLLCERSYLIAFLVLLLAFPAAWLCGAFVYAFGELVDKVCDINATLRHAPETCPNDIKKPLYTQAADCPRTDYAETSPPSILANSPVECKVKTGGHPIEDSDMGETVCPYCSTSLWYLKELVGDTVPCPHCGEKFTLNIIEENE